jgi:hypothetical protein
LISSKFELINDINKRMKEVFSSSLVLVGSRIFCFLDVIWVVDISDSVGRKQVAKCVALHKSVGGLKLWMVS